MTNFLAGVALLLLRRPNWICGFGNVDDLCDQREPPVRRLVRIFPHLHAHQQTRDTETPQGEYL